MNSTKETAHFILTGSAKALTNNYTGVRPEESLR